MTVSYLNLLTCILGSIHPGTGAKHNHVSAFEDKKKLSGGEKQGMGIDKVVLLIL